VGSVCSGAGITDRRVTFHSFRHLYKRACRDAEVSQEMHDSLTGHVSGSVGGGYGRDDGGMGFSLSTLAAAVAKIGYPGFPL